MNGDSKKGLLPLYGAPKKEDKDREHDETSGDSGDAAATKNSLDGASVEEAHGNVTSEPDKEESSAGTAETDRATDDGDALGEIADTKTDGPTDTPSLEQSSAMTEIRETDEPYGDDMSDDTGTNMKLSEILSQDKHDDVVRILESFLEQEDDIIEIQADDMVLDVSKIATVASFIGAATSKGYTIRLVPDGASGKWPWNLFLWTEEENS